MACPGTTPAATRNLPTSATLRPETEGNNFAVTIRNVNNTTAPFPFGGSIASLGVTSDSIPAFGYRDYYAVATYRLGSPTTRRFYHFLVTGTSETTWQVAPRASEFDLIPPSRWRRIYTKKWRSAAFPSSTSIRIRWP
jgi:hypothetical protein